ncbi:tyrosine-type recombinase/integrase [Hyphococcus sp.]|uniref:tyrosine-type recombinase/integrase n=1 Tax=Hyphococcus sp. TaxID=2038636 RepID=UPI003CCC34FD
MRKFCEENERIKRGYFEFLREAEGLSEPSIVKVEAALVRFETSTGYKSFKAFHIDQAVAFKKSLGKAKHPETGKPLSKATISATLRTVKAFFKWLAWQQGYKSRIGKSDCEYFNLPAKDEAVAHAHREKPFPSMEQALHAFRNMPEGGEIEQRDKALFAFLVLTGVRDGAAASLKLKHIDLIEGEVIQDAREVKTKASKTIYTWFFPVAAEFRECFEQWVAHLREEPLFGPDDPLFPQTAVGFGPSRRFEPQGLKRAHWSTAAPIRKIIGDAFEAAGLPRFGPHSFRKTLVQLGERTCNTPEEFKAWSQNLGHEQVLTTFTSYGSVSRHRQGEIIKSLGEAA